jgi:hypothetical protein
VLVTPPADPDLPRVGHVALPELTEGRIVRQPFVARQDNLRRIDVLTATFARVNRGTLTVRVLDESGRVVAARTEATGRVPDNDWFHVEFGALRGSKGRRFTIELAGQGATPGSAVTAWAGRAGGPATDRLMVDGRATEQVLWFRAFGADEALGDAPLIYARDLNIYRNPHARPRAWFVQTVDVLPAGMHLDRLAGADFDVAGGALVDAPLAVAPSDRARVRSVDLSDPDELDIVVDAPDGGVLVVSQRSTPGWTATVDGRPTPLVRANAVLMALAVPQGARRVVLRFRHPWLRLGGGISVLALLVTLLVGFRPVRARLPGR